MANKLIVFEQLQRYDKKIKAFIKAQIDVVTSALSAHSSDIESLKSGKADKSDIPIYTNATTTKAGLMSAQDKSKLDNIDSGGGGSKASVLPRSLSEVYRII